MERGRSNERDDTHTTTSGRSRRRCVGRPGPDHASRFGRSARRGARARTPVEVRPPARGDDANLDDVGAGGCEELPPRRHPAHLADGVRRARARRSRRGSSRHPRCSLRAPGARAHALQASPGLIVGVADGRVEPDAARRGPRMRSVALPPTAWTPGATSATTARVAGEPQREAAAEVDVLVVQEVALCRSRRPRGCARRRSTAPRPTPSAPAAARRPADACSDSSCAAPHAPSARGQQRHGCGRHGARARPRR